MVHMGDGMEIDQTPSARLRRIVGDALSGSGMGQRRLEAAMSLPRWALRGLMDPTRQQSPSIDRAAEICSALGYELVIRPRGEGPRDGVDSYSALRNTSRPRPADPPLRPPAPPSPRPGGAPGAALEPVSDRRLAEVLAAVADEYEALDAVGQASMLTRIWSLHPELRERERAARRVVAWLGWRVLESPARGRAGEGA